MVDEFWGLSKDQLVRVLRSEELRIEDEYQVFTAAMEWMHQDVALRRKHVVEVLEPVRFPLLSPQRLLKYIEGEGRSRAPGKQVVHKVVLFTCRNDPHWWRYRLELDQLKSLCKSKMSN